MYCIYTCFVCVCVCVCVCVYIYTYIYIYVYIYVLLLYIQSWPKISTPLVNMINEGCENVSAILILLIFYIWNKSQKSNLSLDNNNFKWGEISLWNKRFFSNTHWTQLLAPLEILMSKISLKNIPIHIHNFEHCGVNMKLSSHGFLFPRNINRRENKALIPLIIHHNEKNQRIYFWCAAKDNWASQISEVALRKELEQWKFPFPPSGQ